MRPIACVGGMVVLSSPMMTFSDWLSASRRLFWMVRLLLPRIFFISQRWCVLITKMSGVVVVPRSTKRILLLKYSAIISATLSSCMSGFGFIPTGMIKLYLLIFSIVVI